jgi:lipid-binding SYLF domain-containing protein
VKGVPEKDAEVDPGCPKEPKFMKKIGILFVTMLLSGLMAMAQSSSSASGSTSGNDTNNDVTKQQHKDKAVADENAAQNAKDKAKNASSGASEDHDKALARLDEAGKVMHQLMAMPDTGIPQEVLDNAKCVAVIPSMLKGGFIFGAEHGRGVATCRAGNGWTAPAFFVATGGNWGAQIGGQATDLVMLIMNENGMNQLLASKFKIGGDASAAAGPVGRQASASTDWKMKSEILTYSRSRGLYAGAVLNGVVVKADEDAMIGYYGHDAGFRPVLTGKVKDPMAGNDRFVSAVRNSHAEATAKADDK